MSSRSQITGLAAVGAVALTIALVTRRRFRLGWFLFQVAVALGERWKEGRDTRRVATLLSVHPDTADRAA